MRSHHRPLTIRLLMFVALLLVSTACNAPAATAATASPASTAFTPEVTFVDTSTPPPATATSPATAIPTQAATSTPAATPTDSATATPTMDPNANPFTGLPVDPAVNARIPILIKVSNSPETRPQSGLSLADVVVEHYSEGGLTRFTALYHTNTPAKVGSVRSCRLVEIELVVMFGAGVVCSGTSGGVRQEIKASKSWEGSGGDVRKTTWMVSDLGAYECRSQAGCKLPMFRTADAYAPHNLFGNANNALAELTDRGMNTPTTFNTWAFSAAPVGGRDAVTVVVPYTGGTVSWQYDDKAGQWARTMVGRPHLDRLSGKQIMASNVLVVYVHHVRTLIQEDAGGSRSIQVQLWGDGPAQVFRDGKVIDGFWYRTGNATGLAFRDRSGNVIPLKPGASWIQLVPLDLPVKSS